MPLKPTSRLREAGTRFRFARMRAIASSSPIMPVARSPLSLGCIDEVAARLRASTTGLGASLHRLVVAELLALAGATVAYLRARFDGSRARRAEAGLDARRARRR